VRKQIARGAMWMLLFRVTEKSLGLISTIVLARLLLPEDFGLVAMALSIIAVVELASSFSFETVLIQKAQPERADYDTAWTLNVLFAAGCAATMVLLARPAAAFYADPRLVPVIVVIAIGWALQGVENVGIVDFRRRMDFRREFQFLALKRLAGFGVTMALAFAVGNYWALVAGMLSGRLAGTLASYVMSPYRPRPSLAARRSLFRFSSWLLLSNVINFAETRFAHFFIGRVSGSASLGLFTVATDLANLPTTELSAPINRAALPGYARLADKPEELRADALMVIGVIAVVTIPLTFGTAALAEPLIGLVMGTTWRPMVPLLKILVLGACIRALLSNYHPVFLALGRPHLTPILEGARVAVLIPLIIISAHSLGVIGVAYAHAACMSVSFVVSTVVLLHNLRASARQFLAQLSRPLAAALIMYGVIALVAARLESDGVSSHAALLCIGTAVGATTFVSMLLLIWFLAGRPAGAESMLLHRAANAISGLPRGRSGPLPPTS
jgi:O-antigen/teichoic acid export membrane protein